MPRSATPTAMGDLDLLVANYVEAVVPEELLTGTAMGAGNTLLYNEAGRLEVDHGALDQAAIEGLTLHAGLGSTPTATSTSTSTWPTTSAHTCSPTACCSSRTVCWWMPAKTASADVAQYSMGTAVGDPDNDGDADIFVTNLAATRYLANDGTGAFYDASLNTGLRISDEVHDTSWGAAFADVDQDGFEDLFVTYGRLLPQDRTSADFDLIETEEGLEDPFEQPDMLLLSDAGVAYTDVADQLGLAEPGISKSVSLGDLNRDAQVDFVVVGHDFLTVYLSAGSAHSGAAVSLWHEGAPDPYGTGARIVAEVGERIMTRWMVPGAQGSFGASAPQVYFGLGDADVIDVLRVTWPDGSQTVLEEVEAGEILVER